MIELPQCPSECPSRRRPSALETYVIWWAHFTGGVEVDSLLMALAVHLFMCPQEWVMSVPCHCEVRDDEEVSNGLSHLWISCCLGALAM